MKTNDHLIGDRVSVRCAVSVSSSSSCPDWQGGRIIAREGRPGLSRYVVQLDDNRRVVAFEADVRRWTLAFDVVEMLERMAS